MAHPARRTSMAPAGARIQEQPLRIRVCDHESHAINAPAGQSVLVQVYKSAPWQVARALLAKAHRDAVERSGGARAPGAGSKFYYSSEQDAGGAPASIAGVSADSEPDDDEPSALAMSDARIFLLPGGEEIHSTALLRENDSVTVHRGESHPPPVAVLSRSHSSAAASPTEREAPQPKPVPARQRFASTAAILKSDPLPRSRELEAPPRRRRRSIATATAAPASAVAELADGAEVDALMAELSGQSHAHSHKAKDAPKKRFQRAVQRVIFVNRFKSEPESRGLEGRTFSKSSVDYVPGGIGGSVSGVPGNRAGSVAASVIGKGRSTKRSNAGKSVDAYIKNLVDLYEYSQNREIDDRINQEKLPWHVVNPDSPLKTAWDVMTLILVVYFAFMVPYRIGFDVELNQGEQLLDTISDIIFIVDLVISFRTAFKQDGIMVYDGRRMAVKYLKSWFAIDLLASFPIGWFVSGAETKVNKLFRMLRLFKLFRILRLLKLFPRVMALIETTVKFNPSLLRFLRSFVILFIIWHNIGCIYYFVAREEYGGVMECLPAALARPGQPVGTGKCYVNHCVCADGASADDAQTVTGTVPGWYDPRDPDLWLPHYTIASAPIETQYLQALFWAVEVTTGIGDDIKPKSDTQVIFTTIMAVLGLVVYAVIIGSASSALQNMDSDAAGRREVLESATNFMRARNVPLFFQKIIKDYYDHMWQSPREADEVFADLPASLRARLSIVINRDLVDRIPLLQLIPAEVYIRTVHRLEKATFLPGEYVLRQGQTGESILLIDKGRVDAVLPNGKSVFTTMYPGDFFGESSLLYGTLRDASFRAVDYLDVYIMDKSTFEELSVSAPGFLTEVRRVDADRQAARLRLELRSSLGVAASPDAVKQAEHERSGTADAGPGAPGAGHGTRRRASAQASGRRSGPCGSACLTPACLGGRVAPEPKESDGLGAASGSDPTGGRLPASRSAIRFSPAPKVPAQPAARSAADQIHPMDRKLVSTPPSFVYVRSASTGSKSDRVDHGRMARQPFTGAAKEPVGDGGASAAAGGLKGPGQHADTAGQGSPAEDSLMDTSHAARIPDTDELEGSNAKATGVSPVYTGTTMQAPAAATPPSDECLDAAVGAPFQEHSSDSQRRDAAPSASALQGTDSSPQLQRADRLLQAASRLGIQAKASGRGSTPDDDDVADLFLRALRRNKRRQ